MTAIEQTRISRLRLPIFPSIVMFALACVLWLHGIDALALLPWLCFTSALVTARHILFEAKFPSLFTWFAAVYIGLFLVYPIVAPLLGMEMPTSNEVFVDYCFLAVCGLHLFIIGYELASSRQYAKRRWDVRYRTTSDRLFGVICLLLSLNIFASFLVLAEAGSFSTLTLRTRDEMKFAVGILSMSALYLYMIGAVMYPLVGAYVRHRKYRVILWLPIIIGLEVLLFLMFRVRTFPVMHGLGLLLGWFLIAPRIEIARSRSKHPLRMRLTAVQKASIIALIVALVIGMFVLRVFRGEFENANSLAEIEIDVVGSVQYAFESGGELGYSKWVFRILEVVPEHHDYLHGQSYYRLLFIPIPRSLWPGKPLNTQRIVAQWIDPGVVSIHTTPVGVIGDLYVNFGCWGILGMLVFGYAFGRADRGRQLTYALFLAISFTMVFHLVRGGFTNPLLEMVVSFIMVRLVAKHLCREVSVQRAGASPVCHEDESSAVPHTLRSEPTYGSIGAQETTT